MIFDSLWYILIVSCTSILNKASFIFLPSKHKLHVLLGFQLCCPCCHNIFILRFRVYVSAGNMWMWWGFLVGTNTRGLEECVWNNIRLTFFMAVWVWMCPPLKGNILSYKLAMIKKEYNTTLQFCTREHDIVWFVCDCDFFIFAVASQNSMPKSHFVRKSGKAKKWPTQILLIFIHITYIIDNSNTIKFFGLKLYGLGVWTQQNCYLEQKNTAFFTKMDFWGHIWAQGNACTQVFCKIYKIWPKRIQKL